MTASPPFPNPVPVSDPSLGTHTSLVALEEHWSCVEEFQAPRVLVGGFLPILIFSVVPLLMKLVWLGDDERRPCGDQVQCQLAGVSHVVPE